MKIVMIGPVFPYKGGIAHYTGMMSRNLAKEHTVINISFKLQYPKFLYRREQKDYGCNTFKMDNTQFILNSVNLFSWIRVARLINHIIPDLVIIQWWHPFFSPAYWTILKLLKKNIKVLFLCHNVLPHESFPFKKWFAKAVLNQGDIFIVQSSLDVVDLNSLVKNPAFRQVVLPTFNAFKMTNISKIESRKQLSLCYDTPVLLFFGFIREYKGLKHLVRAMPTILSALPQTRLLVVGDFFENNKAEYLDLIAQTGTKQQIILVDGYVPDTAVEKYFSACDLVVLPYESATQSGIVQIAYGFDKPVIATNVGGLPDVVLDGETGFLVPPLSEEALAEAVIRFFKEDKAKDFEQNIKQEADKYSWDRMNELINEFGKQG